MNQSRWERITEIFHATLAREPNDRSAFLAAACSGDPSLQSEIESLLAAFEEAPDLLELSHSDVRTQLNEELDQAPTDSERRSAVRSIFPIGSRIGERYRVLQLLGRGGMGEVYEAHDDDLSIPVALKTLHARFSQDRGALARLKLEVLHARAVTDLHVCRVYDVGHHQSEDDVIWFLTMELLIGETLEQRLRRVGRLTAAEAMPIVAQMVAGLAAAHRAGVIHRDFKTGNVMLVPCLRGERAVVTDFGVSRAIVPISAHASRGRASSVMIGTPAYMAPEQLRGEEATPAADIYGLGVVLYQIVTGSLPWKGSALDAGLRRLYEEPPRPRNVVPMLEPGWDATIVRCLARDPHDRFAHVEDVCAALVTPTLAQHSKTLPTDPWPRAMHGLPAELDSFVGRDSDLASLQARFATGVRLITLLGAGGMGKTRLAMHYGWRSLPRWSGGAWFCDLTEAKTVDGIAATVAAVLDVTLGTENSVRQIGHAIAARGPCLVILDNFEHVVRHAEATVCRWLDRAPEARFIVTSRERLKVRGEEVHVVEPLDVESGVELFAERARRLRPQFASDGAESEPVREIVQLADGIPLAIELAAGRVRLMTTKQLAARMEERLRLLAGEGRGRHGSLRAAIDASWELLTLWEQSAWIQCSVFEGGFTLEAAEAVLDLTPWPEASFVVDVIQSLVDKSLLRLWVPDARGEIGAGDPRFSIYAGLQEYARGKGKQQATVPTPTSLPAAETRHGQWYARYGTDEVLEALNRVGGVDRRRYLTRELDNTVEACRRAVRRRDSRIALGAYRAAWEVLYRRGPLELAVQLGRDVLTMSPELGGSDQARCLVALGGAETKLGENAQAEEHLLAALSAARKTASPELEGLVSRFLGALHLNQGLWEDALAYYKKALALDRQVGNRLSEGRSLQGLGVMLRQQGRMMEARTHQEAALTVAREAGDRHLEGICLEHLGVLHHEQGRLEEGKFHYEAALMIHREVGNRRSESSALGNLGNLYRDRGLMEDARAYYEGGLRIQRESGDRRFEAMSLANLGALCLELGNVREAQVHFEAALSAHREVGNRRFEGIVLGHLGACFLTGGDVDEARALLGEAECILRDAQDRTELGKLLCVRAELELRCGDREEAFPIMREAELLAHQVGASSETELGRKLQNLHRILNPTIPGEQPSAG